MPFEPIAAISLELLPVTVTPLLAPGNPTGDVVQFAFMPYEDRQAGAPPVISPAGGDWVTASWLGSQTVPPYVAQCLIGPTGAKTLTAGDWDVWIKFTDNPEAPARWVDILKIY